MQEELGFFSRNKAVLLAIIIACILFVSVFLLEKTKVIVNMVPILRGEVSLNRDIVITTLKTGELIIVKREDDTVSNQIRFSGDVRSKFDEVVHSFRKNANIIVEVGAHFGYRTILFGKEVKNKGKVYAFEANINILSLLKKSIILNDLEETVVLRGVAISDHSGSISIRDALTSACDKNEYTRDISVNCSTLDNEMAPEQKKSIDLLSIDIPGDEISVLKGSYEVIDRSPNIVIVISFDNDPIAKEAKEEFQKLANKGFCFYCYNNEKRLSKLSIDELIQQKEIILVITRRMLNGDEVKNFEE